MTKQIHFANEIVHQLNIGTAQDALKLNAANQNGELKLTDFQIINFKLAATKEVELLYMFYRPTYILSATAEQIKAHGCTWCVALNYFNMPKLTSVGISAFIGCVGLVCVDAQNVVKVQDSAFAYCHNLKVVRMDKLREVSKSCFYECQSLQACSFASVQVIEKVGFSKCLSLSELRMPSLQRGEASCISTFQTGFKFVPEIPQQLKEKLVSVQKIITRVVRKFEHKYHLMSKQIASLPFQLKAVTSNVSIVPKEAFMNSYNLATATLPNAIKIDQRAFLNCYSLFMVRCRKLKFVERAAFDTCHNLQSVIGSQIAQIRGNAFKDCFSLNNLDLSKLQVLEKQAFSKCYWAVNVKSNQENHSTVVKQLRNAKIDCRIFVVDGYRMKQTGERLRLIVKKVKAFKQCAKQMIKLSTVEIKIKCLIIK